MNNNQHICFLGAGHMARGLILGLHGDGYPANNIWATNPSSEKLDDLQNLTGINVTTDNLEGVKNADVVVLSVKPNTIASVLQEILPVWQQHKPLVISVAAGFKVAAMQRELGNEASIIRAMPNMAALVGSGATGLYANTNVSEDSQGIAESILRSVGIIHWVDSEDQLDKLTSLSGSGPGYLFYMMEAMADKAIDFGLDPEAVHLFTAQTFLGAARIALESEQTFEELRQSICSKGGTTEQGVRVLEQHHMRQALEEAMQTTYERACTIGEQLSGQNDHD